jgi:hypothetical protein
MSSEAKQVLALFHKRDELLGALAEVNARIVRATLDLGRAAQMPAPRGSAKGRAAGAGTRRKWFERGEMLTISRKVLTKPMAQADLVRALSTAKGYDKGLSAPDKARFQSACYQAIASALATKKLSKDRAGKILPRKA